MTNELQEQRKLAIEAAFRDSLAQALTDLIEDAERHSMGFPSKWVQAEAYFAARDHFKILLKDLATLPPLPAEDAGPARRQLEIIRDICNGKRGPEDEDSTPFETIGRHAERALANFHAEDARVKALERVAEAWKTIAQAHADIDNWLPGNQVQVLYGELEKAEKSLAALSAPASDEGVKP